MFATALLASAALAEEPLPLLEQHPAVAAADWNAVEEIVVELGEHSYHPDAMTLTIGKPYKLILKNIGAVSHDMVGGSFFDEKVIALRWVTTRSGRITAEHIESVYLRPLHDTELWLVPLQVGEFTFFCSLPGHRDAGMEGIIHVAR